MDVEAIKRDGVWGEAGRCLRRVVPESNERLVTLLILPVDLEELQAVVVRAVRRSDDRGAAVRAALSAEARQRRERRVGPGPAGGHEADTGRGQARRRRVRADDNLRGAALRLESVVADEGLPGTQQDRVARLCRIDRGLEVRVHAPARAHGARGTLCRAGEKHRGRERPHGKPEQVHVAVSYVEKSRNTRGRSVPGLRAPAGCWQDLCHATRVASLLVFQDATAPSCGDRRRFLLSSFVTITL